MSYLVMETHPAFVVVLDEQGRFLKAANQNYQVGQRLNQIIPLVLPKPALTISKKAVVSLAGLAACLCLVFGGYFGYYQPNFTVYGSMLVQINPQVELTLSQTQRVLELEGLNADGQTLLEGYDYQNKTRDTVVEELVQRAMDMGFLSDGESITLTVNGEDGDWNRRQEEETLSALESRYGNAIVIQIGGNTQQAQSDQEIIIPLPSVSQSTASQPSAPPAATDDDDENDDDWEDDDEDDDREDDDDDDDDSSPSAAASLPSASRPQNTSSNPGTDDRDDDDDDDDDDDGDDGDDDNDDDSDDNDDDDDD